MQRVYSENCFELKINEPKQFIKFYDRKTNFTNQLCLIKVEIQAFWKRSLLQQWESNSLEVKPNIKLNKNVPYRILNISFLIY